ncbi:MAG: acyl-CoA/acyl-ACP dehydrogenase [Deltaproteobacteria bacterium]|nr:acyl-CoA/acyl-ACP dehydrogenase [Deltaproteobacteria bacterium]MBW1927715.1 acyl-CoA/acyl-ACP dehydrogenase [Deltaproteobacteria bacterium]MBW2025102.1 acyl-CoA/acyl-ACP dehydrogenase [Deltaproteobacteria bacterium]MBW2125844.1 acyl-CoA/acyl-ACP dehydrogenase [Deltaproteobacteria bacterium]RLB22843.1 MAG: acyl-CoA dehydrogenase [Deltaproteobacteria bacterium]
MDFNLSKEQRDIVRAAREFAQGEFPDRAAEFDRNETFDLELWKTACELGFVGVFIDEKYGGAGLGFLEHCLITEEFWAVEPGIGQAILSTTFGSELLSLFGSEEQKQEVLPQLVSGQAIMATGITEPDAGSDVTQATTTAVKDGDSWVINGAKMFTTNGNLAKYVLLFCLTDPDNPSRHERHSFILVPTDTPGYESTKIYGKMGIRASDTAELTLNNLQVPLSNLVGEQGRGFHQLMAFFNRTRLHICAQAVGLARGAMEEAIRHAKARRQFGATLASFQVTQFKIAEMATWIRAARNLYYEAAWSVDQGKIDHALIAMAKWFSAEMAVRCADEALQLHGGYGYIDEYKVQRLYRDAKILEIYEGTKEMEKTIISRTLLG